MNKRLFVAGLPFSTTSDELKNLFAAYGTVVAANVITDRESGRSKGFGFVEMETDEEAQSAIAKLEGSEFGGRKLIVSVARPKEDRPRENRWGDQKRSFGGRREGGRGNFGRDKGSFERRGFRRGRS